MLSQGVCLRQAAEEKGGLKVQTDSLSSVKINAHILQLLN